MGRVLTEEQFDEEFRPIDHPDGGYYWSDYKDVQTSGVPVERIWAVADGENSATIVMPGIHMVNVFAWVITEVPWTLEMDIDYVNLGRGGDMFEIRSEETEALLKLIGTYLASEEALDEDTSDDLEKEDFINALYAVQSELEELMATITRGSYVPVNYGPIPEQTLEGINGF